jgi:uncharacterized membrane protein YedE/YeeE
MRALAGLGSGVLFGIGLALSGMTRPAKVLAFLDVAGAWDPSLAFVMLGAIAVFAPLYLLIRRRSRPVLAPDFVVAPTAPIDAKLIAGAVLFGLGWGAVGFCPGPALVSAGTAAPAALVFGACMLAGMLLFRGYERWRAARVGLSRAAQRSTDATWPLHSSPEQTAASGSSSAEHSSRVPSR